MKKRNTILTLTSLMMVSIPFGNAGRLTDQIGNAQGQAAQAAQAQLEAVRAAERARAEQALRDHRRATEESLAQERAARNAVVHQARQLNDFMNETVDAMTAVNQMLYGNPHDTRGWNRRLQTANEFLNDVSADVKNQVLRMLSREARSALQAFNRDQDDNESGNE